MKKGTVLELILFTIVILSLIGEIKCIYKACVCNWDPIDNAEVIYTAASCTGFGAILGWIDIKDN